MYIKIVKHIFSMPYTQKLFAQSASSRRRYKCSYVFQKLGFCASLRSKLVYQFCTVVVGTQLALGFNPICCWVTVQLRAQLTKFSNIFCANVMYLLASFVELSWLTRARGSKTKTMAIKRIVEGSWMSDLLKCRPGHCDKCPVARMWKCSNFPLVPLAV